MRVLVILLLVTHLLRGETRNEFFLGLAEARFVGLTRSGVIKEVLYGELSDEYKMKSEKIKNFDSLYIVYKDTFSEYHARRYYVKEDLIRIRNRKTIAVLVKLGDIRSFLNQRAEGPKD